MFEKLLSSLPTSPGFIHQMSFYSRRMRQETAIRRTGMVFILLAFMVQFVAFISPPQATSAWSNNDLITGGVSGSGDAQRNCDQNNQHYAQILNYYGISCQDVGRSDGVTINACTENYFSFGHIAYGKPGEMPVNVPNIDTIFARKLGPSWGCGPWAALKVKSSVTGEVFYILKDCGNLVTVGVPHAPNRCKYDDSILASDKKCYKPCDYDKKLPADSPKCYNPCKFDHSIPASSNKCYNPCKFNPSIPASSDKCVKPCPIPGLQNLPKDSPKCNQPCPYNKKLPANSPKCFEPCKYNSNLPADSPKCFEPCKYNSNIPSSSPECKSCDKASSANPYACVEIHKKASNETQQLGDANDTEAAPGDVITYTLSATNTGKDDVKGYVFQENLSDVLDYADVVDLHGGSINSEKVVTWPAETIKPSNTASHQITVKVKDPVPQTPAAPSDPNHFDLIMTNVYGDTINIRLPGSPEKTVEAAAATLPNTGPGTTLMIAASIVMVGGYFYGRARLLAEESAIAVQDAAAA